MNEKEFIEMSSKLSKNLGIVSQYILILMPFICKFIVKTIKEIKKQNTEFACKNAMKSGFWNEEMEIFGNCLDKLRDRELNNNATNEMCNKRLYSEDDECQAIEEIMNALDRNKLNTRFLKSKESFSTLIDEWASEIAKSRKEKVEKNNFDEILKDPISYYGDNYNFESKRQNAKVNKIKNVIEEMLKNAEKSDALYRYFESLYSTFTDENKIFKVVLKDLEENKMKSPIYPIIFPAENIEIHRTDSNESSVNSVDLKETIPVHSPFIEKYDLNPSIDMDEFPSNGHELSTLTLKKSKVKSVSLPSSKIEKPLVKQVSTLTSKKSKDKSVSIPSSKNDKPLVKHVSLPKNKLVINKPEKKLEMFKKKEVEEFSNLKNQILKKREAKLKKEKYKKIDLSQRIKLKQKSLNK